MDAEQNPTSRILDNHLPQPVGEETRMARAHRPVVIPVTAIELVGHKEEVPEESVGALVIRGPSVKHPSDVKGGSPESSMSRRIGREIRREIFEARRVCARRTERKPTRVAVVEVGINGVGRRGSKRPIMFAYADDRPPKVVAVFLLPSQYSRVSHGRIDKGEEASVVALIMGSAEGRVSDVYGHLADDLVIEARRGAQAVRAVVPPVDTCERVRRGSASVEQRSWQRRSQLGPDASSPHVPKRP